MQFRGGRDASGAWLPGTDPLLSAYAARGYPVRALHGFPGMSVVGFPALPLVLRLGPGARLVTAPEATPEEQYAWLRLLEQHWIGAERGNQVSYTLKIDADRIDLPTFRAILRTQQPHVRGCTLLPVRAGDALGHEYLPEEEVDEARFTALLAGIHDPGLHEAIGPAWLECARGVCPP